MGYHLLLQAKTLGPRQREEEGEGRAEVKGENREERQRRERKKEEETKDTVLKPRHPHQFSFTGKGNIQ